jgi:hypothetical protein
MAEEGTLAINDNVVKKAGEAHNTTYSAEAYTNFYIKLAEGKLCLDTRWDWVTNYSSVSDIGKEVLREAVSCLAAVDVATQDQSGFTDREFTNLINVLWARYSDIVKRIVDDTKYKDFIKTGTGDID